MIVKCSLQAFNTLLFTGRSMPYMCFQFINFIGTMSGLSRTNSTLVEKVKQDPRPVIQPLILQPQIEISGSSILHLKQLPQTEIMIGVIVELTISSIPEWTQTLRDPSC